jgi:hypothetical protein
LISSIFVLRFLCLVARFVGLVARFLGFGILLRGFGPHGFAATVDATEEEVPVVLVIGPLAAVIGAATVVIVVVAVVVLKVMVTGPHVTTVGCVPLRATSPHWALLVGGAAGAVS